MASRGYRHTYSSRCTLEQKQRIAPARYRQYKTSHQRTTRWHKVLSRYSTYPTCTYNLFSPRASIIPLSPYTCVHSQDRSKNLPKQKAKRTAALLSLDIGIAEGWARTHDLEVDLFCCHKSHTLYRLSYPGKGFIGDEVGGC